MEKFTTLPAWVYYQPGLGSKPEEVAAAMAAARASGPPGAALWSGAEAPPPIGADVVLTINGIGRAKVVGYAVDGDWLGLLTVVYRPPNWWIQQNGMPSEKRPALSFGCEHRAPSSPADGLGDPVTAPAPARKPAAKPAAKAAKAAASVGVSAEEKEALLREAHEDTGAGAMEDEASRYRGESAYTWGRS